MSHHGSYVSIVSSSSELVGVDIVDTRTRAPSMAKCATDFINIYRKQLAAREISKLLRYGYPSSCIILSVSVLKTMR